MISLWEHEKMCKIEQLLRRWNHKYVVPTQKLRTKRWLCFTTKKELTCCILKKYSAKSSKWLFSQINHWRVSSFHRKRQGLLGEYKQGHGWWTIHYKYNERCLAETAIRDSSNRCRTLVSIDASQFDPCSTCHATPAGLYIKKELHSETGKLKRRQNKTRSFENMVISYFQRVTPQWKVEGFYTTGTQKKITHTVLMAFVDTAALWSKLWDAFITKVH